MVRKRVAIIGAQGVPAAYGGFESLIENLIETRTQPGIEYTIFCSSKDMAARPEGRLYKGCQLRYLPLHANGIQSIPYDILSIVKALRGFDTILILGVSGCMALPVIKHLTHARIVVNIDGLEHRRHKWGSMARRFLKMSERAAVRHADVVIADNPVIARYVTERYHRQPTVITYAGDRALREVTAEKQAEILNRYGVNAGEYAVSVCRIEPENNPQMILETAQRAGVPMLFVGNWQHNEYSRCLYREFANVPGLILVDAVYDLDILHAFRANALCYIHGHSAGGTNPSLVEAMFFGKPILAFDVDYNRETTAGRALYFSTSDQLETSLRNLSDNDNSESRNTIGLKLLEIARSRYTSTRIAEAYESLY